MGISYSFLTKEQAKVELLKPDDFLHSLNDKNLNYYVQASELLEPSLQPYTLQNYLDIISQACDEFHHKRKEKIGNVISKINPIWERNNLPKLHVNFIQTTGHEAFGLPYTRGNCVVIPGSLKNYSNKFSILDQVSGGLIIHEIFHILTRTYPQLKTELYSLFSFFEIKKQNIEEFIINPDAPFYNQGIKLKDDDGNEFTGVLNIHLKIKDEKERMEWKEIYNLESKTYIPFNKTNLVDLIGKNTEYIIHPEEICAEHFRLLFVDEDPDNQGFFSKYFNEIEDREKLLLFKNRLNNFKF